MPHRSWIQSLYISFVEPHKCNTLSTTVLAGDVKLPILVTTAMHNTAGPADATNITCSVELLGITRKTVGDTSPCSLYIMANNNEKLVLSRKDKTPGYTVFALLDNFSQWCYHIIYYYYYIALVMVQNI